ncbi:MAG: preprotein translocase subunit SecE [Candidatus Saccharibacteria bacterium]|nr:preprotein translocase subunit SecE [Candidatus Saccharibacteria bacterium]
MAKPKITRIKAGESSKKVEEESTPITRKKVILKDKKQVKNAKKEAKEVKKTEKKKEKKPFILIRPFVYLGRYLKESWKELRQVRWPSRKATWKMVLAVLIYTAAFVVFITLLDVFFSWLFNLIIK